MTEADAKTKWCPFSRISSNGAVINRDNNKDSLITDTTSATRCLGSVCCLWMVEDDRTNDGHCGMQNKTLYEKPSGYYPLHPTANVCEKE